MSLFQELRSALIQRCEIIADREYYERDPKGHLEALKSVSERISRIAEEVPQDIDPQFRHYLTRCSYDKALAWLEQYLKG